MERVLPRKQRDRRRREDDFLAAAERLFSERGYFETSMEDVAQTAEYAIGTIYRYFESKDDLYHQLLLRKGRIYYMSIMDELQHASSNADKLRALIRGEIHFFLQHRDFIRIYLQHVARPVAGARCQSPPELMELRDEYRQMIRDLLQEGMTAGEWRTVDVELTLAAMTGLTQELVLSRLEEDLGHSEDLLVSFAMEFLQQGIHPRRGRSS